ncbi:hypothetical protein [Halarchaeum grantii]|nr:hypothetical protein [Halarchaeum grantii]
MKRISALALVVLVVGSLVVPFVGGAVAAGGAPSGMTGVPDGNIDADVPAGESLPVDASDLQGQVYASEYAQSLDVTLTTAENADDVVGSDSVRVSGDGMALVLSDSQHHAGREVGIEATVLRQSLGYLPEAVYGVHDDGSKWQRSATYRDGWLVFTVPEFSSNVVSFTGEVSINATPATDGTSASWSLSSTDAVSAPVVNVTGVQNTETDVKSVSSASDGSTTNLSVAGTSVSPATVNVTDVTPTSSVDYADSSERSTSSQTTFTVPIDSDSRPISGVNVEWTLSGSVGWDADAAVYVAGGDVGSSVFSDGELVQEYSRQDAPWDTVYKEESIDPSISGVNTLTIGLEVRSSSSDFDAMTVTDHDSDGEAISVSVEEDLSLAVSDSETGDSATVTSPGTYSLDISTSTTDLSWSGSGSVDGSISYEERTQTANASVELNGNATTVHSGTLADGETVSATLAKSDLREGTNRLNVTMGDGSLSADAPEMQADVTLTHDATDRISTTYDGEKWSERYNISHTFAGDRGSASATIPFANEVVGIRSIEASVNGSEWSPVSTSDYALSADGNDLTVDLDGVVGGDITAGTSVSVRTTGTRVHVSGGSIKVTEPTTRGERLDSEVAVLTRGSGDFAISTGTPSPDTPPRIHYTYDESWDADERAVVTSGGSQSLVMPSVGASDTFRVSTIPVVAEPETAAGDVAVRVDEPAQTTPQFEVSGSAHEGDTIRYTFLDAQDDTTYSLYSQTRDVVLDSGTANSPLTLSGADDAGVLEFVTGSDGASQPSDSGETGLMGPVPSSTTTGVWDALSTPLVILTGVVALIVLWLVQRRFSDSDPARSRSSGPLSLVASTATSSARWGRRHPGAVGVLAAVVGVGLIATGVISVPSGTVPALFTVGAPLASYVALGRLGDRSMLVWGAIAGISVVIGLVWMGVDLFGELLNQQVSIVLAVGGLALAYKLVQAYQSPNKVQRFVFRGGDDK